MDAVGTTQAVIGAINYLWTAAAKVKENTEECKRLCDHAQSTISIIQDEYSQDIPDTLRVRLRHLEKYVNIPQVV